MAVQEVPESEAHKSGVISGEMIRENIYHIVNMVVKPEKGTAPCNLAIIGRYFLTPDTFDLIEKLSWAKAEKSELPTPYSNRRNLVVFSRISLKGNVLIAGVLMVISRPPTIALKTLIKHEKNYIFFAIFGGKCTQTAKLGCSFLPALGLKANPD